MAWRSVYRKVGSVKLEKPQRITDKQLILGSRAMHIGRPLCRA